MVRREDLTGKRFGRVTAVRFYDLSSNGAAQWVCRCDCGTKFVTLASSLKAGRTRSCGCYRSEATRERNLEKRK